ncbi:MAG TPA: PPOX class F420-dependent oxidoreductase [Gammaproteobacteria bacterium]|mgnify:CR=1 FL=1|nr:PPOX class F420-dependent oxidoreductase [Gammaproteobacteria bacterium]|tara:strand:+ start:308 stop:703 length:396 start_codon:yes stop_codon:yes gene_type:complete
MTNKIPDNFKDLLNKKAFADLATVMPDGTPQVTPVWFDSDGDQLRINSAKGRQKDRNMRARPAVALAIIDPDNPYRYMQLRGTVSEITEEAADSHIDELAQTYLGTDYHKHEDDETRVIYNIQITPVSTLG